MELALTLRMVNRLVRFHPEGLPLPAGCRPVPPKDGNQVRLLGKGSFLDRATPDFSAVNRRVPGSNPGRGVQMNGDVARWQSNRLLTDWVWVRVPPSPLIYPFVVNHLWGWHQGHNCP